MEIVRIKLSALEPNNGQIPGLPMNPRQWTATDVDKIAQSLAETPELFEARPLLVVPFGDGKKYAILGGNLRHEGAKRNKMKDAPCIIFPPDTPVEKLKEIVIKDNGAFGAWDFDALANEWDDLPWRIGAYLHGNRSPSRKLPMKKRTFPTRLTMNSNLKSLARPRPSKNRCLMN